VLIVISVWPRIPFDYVIDLPSVFKCWCRRPHTVLFLRAELNGAMAYFSCEDPEQAHLLFLTLMAPGRDAQLHSDSCSTVGSRHNCTAETAVSLGRESGMKPPGCETGQWWLVLQLQFPKRLHVVVLDRDNLPFALFDDGV
jgi:hypothetical protein